MSEKLDGFGLPDRPLTEAEREELLKGDPRAKDEELGRITRRLLEDFYRVMREAGL